MYIKDIEGSTDEELIAILECGSWQVIENATNYHYYSLTGTLCGMNGRAVEGVSVGILDDNLDNCSVCCDRKILIQNRVQII